METLRELRRRKGLSQKDLAKKAGIGQDSISGIESGRHEARPSTLRKLAGALDVEVTDFFRDPVTPGHTVEVSGVATGRPIGRSRATPNVPVPLTLRWEIAEAIRSGKQLDPDEVREVLEAIREQLTAE